MNNQNDFESALRQVLIDNGVTDEEVLANTPRRYFKFLEESTMALREPYTDFKSFPATTKFNQMVVVDTSFTSTCEHHLLPFYGKACLAYLPTTTIVGVSKIIKMITHLSKKPTVQEDLVEEIAHVFASNVPSQGVAVALRALHTCVSCRYKEGRMLTTSLNGRFKPDEPTYNAQTQQEFLTYVNMLFKD